MTQTQARDRIRDRLDQTDSSDTEYTEDLVDDAMSEARRLIATVLEDRHLPELRAWASLTAAGGVADYPTDFLRASEFAKPTLTGVVADRIPQEESWRAKYIHNSADTQSSTAVKYIVEADSQIWVYPTTDTALKYPYIKMPEVLGVGDSTHLTDEVEDLTVELAVAKILKTPQGDIELAESIANNAGFGIRNKK